MNDIPRRLVFSLAFALAMGISVPVLEAQNAAPGAAPASAPSTADQRMPVVVASFKDLSGGTERIGEMVAMSVMAGLADCKHVRALERAELEAIIGEIQLGASGLVEEATAAQVGKLVGCRYMVFGSVGQLAGTWQVTWRLIGVENGVQAGAGKARGTKAGLLDIVDRISLDLDELVRGLVAAKK